MDLLASLPALPANSDARKLVLKHAWELRTGGLSEHCHLHGEADFNGSVCVSQVSVCVPGSYCRSNFLFSVAVTVPGYRLHEAAE